MKVTYPVILYRGDDNYIIAYIPDFDITTQGKNMSDAYDMASDAIALTGINMQDRGLTLPSPSDFWHIQTLAPYKASGSHAVNIEVDFDEYRRRHRRFPLIRRLFNYVAKIFTAYQHPNQNQTTDISEGHDNDSI